MQFEIFSGTLGMRLFIISCTLVWAEAVSIEHHILESTKNFNDALDSPTHPFPDFTAYQQVFPRFQHARHNEMLQHTKQEDGSHLDEVILHLEYNGRSMVIDLKINGDLLPTGHFLKYQNPVGSDTVRSNYNRSNTELCHYQGQIRENPQSRVAISTCSGVHGMLIDGRSTFYIASAKATDNSAHDHFMYSHTDFLPKRQPTNDDNSFRNTTGAIQRLRLRKRSASWTNGKFAGPYNSNKDTLYVELVLVADKSLFEKIGTVDKVHDYFKSLANIINSIYMPLNIFVILNGVEVWNKKNKIDINQDANITIAEFAKYKHQSFYSNDNAQLVVGIPFNPHSIVGKGYLSAICDKTNSVGIATDYTSTVGPLASVVAHEMGHNFGFNHDTGDCMRNEFVMAATSSVQSTIKQWSTCSRDWLSLRVRNGAYKCLRNKPDTIYGPSICGNGLVEHGEQCDCGEPATCTNRCCDPATCLLRPSAACATGTCCDLSTCQIRNAGYECRSAELGECDLPEYCTGASEHCPSDAYQRDTEPCGGGAAFCYKGACRSHDDQCRLLYGTSAEACGYDFVKNETSRCAEKDDLCGRLRCKTRGKPLSSQEYRLLLRWNMSNDIYYTEAFGDGMVMFDPGMTPNGARCGESAMCLNQKCRTLKSLWDERVGLKCAIDCSGHGVCDDSGRCVCQIGYGGENCDASPGERDGLWLLIMLLVAAFIGVILLLVYVNFKQPIRQCYDSSFKSTNRVESVRVEPVRVKPVRVEPARVSPPHSKWSIKTSAGQPQNDSPVISTDFRKIRAIYENNKT